jgi:hypothetical protein
VPSTLSSSSSHHHKLLLLPLLSRIRIIETGQAFEGTEEMLVLRWIREKLPMSVIAGRTIANDNARAARRLDSLLEETAGAIRRIAMKVINGETAETIGEGVEVHRIEQVRLKPRPTDFRGPNGSSKVRLAIPQRA